MKLMNLREKLSTEFLAEDICNKILNRLRNEFSEDYKSLKKIKITLQNQTLHGHHMKKRLSKNKPDIYFVYAGNINAKLEDMIMRKNILEYAKKAR